MFDSTISPLRMAYVISLVFVVGILIAAAIKRRSNHSPIGIQAAGNDVAQADACAVPDGATATNFQLLSVFPNVSFGMQGLVVIPLMNVISFLIGNFLVLRWFREFLNAVRQHATPHNFIAKAHGLPSLRRTTALISLFVFTSVACFEIVYLSRISKAVIGGTDSSYYVLVAMLTVSIMLVSIVGGQAVSLATDRWLLVIAYWGTHLAVGFMAMLVVSAKPDMTSLVVIVLLLIMLALRLRQFRSASGRSRIRHLVILLSTIFLLTALFFHKVIFVDWTNSWWANLTEQLTSAGTGLSPMTYAFAAIGSFCAAVFFNFVDFSFWQKYLAEQRHDDDINSVLNRVRKPFFVYIIESPLSWLLPAILGLYALGLVTGANVDQNPITAIVLFLAQNSVYGAIVSIFFYCSLVAIAASTVCGYFASTGYLISADLMLEGDTKSDQAAWLLAIVGVVMVLVLVPVDMFAKSTDQLIQLMLTCFAPLCALSPFVVWPLIKGPVRLSKFGQIGIQVSLAIGSALGLIFGLTAAITGVGPDTVLFWLSLTTSFVASWTLYLIFVNACSQPPVSEG